MESAQGGNPDLERRATVRLVHYWMSICRKDALPAFVDFDPHRNPIGWDRCVLAVCGGPTDVTLEHVGATLVELDSRAAQGRQSDSVPPGIVARMLDLLPEVLSRRAPCHGEGIFPLPGQGRVLFRSVLLPFRSVDETRRYVLGAATFKIDPPELGAGADPAGRRETPSVAGDEPAPPPSGGQGAP